MVSFESVRASDAGDDGIERVAERRREREQRRRLERARARPSHHQHAEEADADRGPAPPAHPFAQDRPRERRDEERRREDDGDRLVELQVAQREKIAHRRSQQQERASDLQRRLAGPQQAGTSPRIRHDQREQERAGVARPDDLQRRHVEVEVFRRGIEQRKARHRAAHQRDAGQALGALVGSIRHGGGAFRSGVGSRTIGISGEQTQCALSA